MTPAEIQAALQAPFPAEELGVKPQTISGNRALAVWYIDARNVMSRLDAVLGIGGWQTTYRQMGAAVVCTLRVKIGGEWVTHEDVGGESDQKDEGDRLKAAVSDSLKRAAVHLGIGRYIYELPLVWADYDPQKKQFVRTPTLPGQPPARPAPAPAPPANGKPAEPPRSRVHQAAASFARKCQKAQLCMAVDVRKHLQAALGGKYRGPLEGWPDSALEDVKAACVKFKAEREKALASQAKAG